MKEAKRKKQSENKQIEAKQKYGSETKRKIPKQKEIYRSETKKKENFWKRKEAEKSMRNFRLKHAKRKQQTPFHFKAKQNLKRNRRLTPRRIWPLLARDKVVASAVHHE